MSKKPRVVPTTQPLSHNPFARLAVGSTQNSPANSQNSQGNSAVPEPAPTAPAATQVACADFSGKVVLRRERKGHAGKTVTLVEGISAGPERLAVICRELRTNLGCGGHVADETLVLAGDQTTRAEAWLRLHGATHVVVGN